MIELIYESGYSQVVYYLFHALCFVGVFVLNYWYCDKFGITKAQSIISSIWIFAVTYVWIYILSWAETGFQYFGGKNLVRGFVYIPIFAYPISRWLKIDWQRMCDFLAPCAPLAQGISKIGCLFAGCCFGYPCEFGMYHPYTEIKAFPCQPFEAITYTVVTILVILFSKRKNYKPGGLAFPLMLMLYGYSRFLWEFARDNLKLIFGCSSLALHALFMAVVGTIAAICITSKRKAAQAAEESTDP